MILKYFAPFLNEFRGWKVLH